MALSQQQVNELIDAIIIDNNIMAIDPYKMRQVLKAINERTQSGLSGVIADSPLLYDAFSNTISLPPINYQERRIKAKGGNELPGLRPGDVVEGWSPNGKSWWDSAIYNGGEIAEEGSYTVIVGTQVIA